MTTHRQGKPATFESPSADPRIRCAFEDDGETGYLYALDYSDGGAQPIKDAVSLYNVQSANDLEIAVEFKWSEDGRKCGLLLNGVLEAFADFDRQLLSAKSNFPAISIWTRQSRPTWDDKFADQLH